MENASGLLITTQEFREFLLFRRSSVVSSSGKYSVPGGMRKSDNPHEIPIETALREAREEIGTIPSGKINPTPLEYNSPKGLHYLTFILEVEPKTKQTYSPDLDFEHDSYLWVRREDLQNYDLHPGLKKVIDQLS